MQYDNRQLIDLFRISRRFTIVDIFYYTYPILNYRFDNLQLRSSRTENYESRSRASVICSFLLIEELATCCYGALKWRTWEHVYTQVSGLVATRMAQFKLPKSSSRGVHFSCSKQESIVVVRDLVLFVDNRYACLFKYCI